MTDSLQLAAAVVVIFVFALLTEIFFSFCRAVKWCHRQWLGHDPGAVPPGRYRRGSVSHNWSETKLHNATTPETIYTPVEELIGKQTSHLTSKWPTTKESTEKYVSRRERRRSSGVQRHHLLYTSDFLQQLEHNWQSSEMICTKCSNNLSGIRYIVRDGNPFCIICYEEMFANTCQQCSAKIGINFKDLSYKEKHWHDVCFKCCDCNVSLVDKPFGFKFNKLYCSECYENNFAARCSRCQNIFRAGMKKYEYKGKQWHEECFQCKICEYPIGSKSFIPRDDEVICVLCYERQFAQRCKQCSGIISSGGILYKRQPWHRECFCCSSCSKMIGREQFTSVEDKPYCSGCYGELFAKKCYQCNSPIMGIGGVKFISFEEKHWHTDCFKCYKCSIALVGCGFLTEGDDVVCPDCCRE